jgi:hypothetical protein
MVSHINLSLIANDHPTNILAADIAQLMSILGPINTADLEPNGKCPVCGDEMEHCEDGSDGTTFHDMYWCGCGCAVTYRSPAKYGEYRDVPAGELSIEIDGSEYGRE